MTWMHSRMLHWEGNLLLHAIRLQGTAVIVKLLGRVLRLMRQPVRLLGSSLGLESSQAVLGTNSKLEKIPVLWLEESPLEPENKLRVDNRCRLGPTSVNLLCRKVLLLRTFAMLLDFVNSVWLSKHGHQVLSSILVWNSDRSSSVPRIEPELGWKSSHLAFVVIVRAVLLLAFDSAIALLDLVMNWMILFFFPAVTVHASVLKVTAVAISFCLLLGAPELTLLFCGIIVDVRLASKVLPIMSVLTLVPLMAFYFVVERAPDCLEVEHVKVSILLHLM